MPNRLNTRSTAPHRLAAAALAAGAVFCGLPALAQGAEAVSVPVRYSPSALKTDAGAQAVYDQIKRAARQACGQPASRALQDIEPILECRQQAVARAVEQIDSPRLAAAHAGDGSAARVAGAGDLHTSR